METYYKVRILPPLPAGCISNEDIQLLSHLGFHPQSGEKEGRDKIIFIAPVYVLDENDRNFKFVDDRGTYEVGTEENSLYGVLVRIMKKADLSCIYLTMVDKFIYRELVP